MLSIASPLKPAILRPGTREAINGTIVAIIAIGSEPSRAFGLSRRAVIRVVNCSTVVMREAKELIENWRLNTTLPRRDPVSISGQVVFRTVPFSSARAHFR